MAGLWQSFRRGLARTVEAIAERTGALFGLRRLDDAALAQLEEALYEADFGVATAEEILGEIRSAYRANRELHGREAAEIGARVLTRVLAGSEGRLSLAAARPHVLCLLGVNGSGKTTTAAKLGFRLQREGVGVVVAAADTFRAAANEQLRTWSTRLGLELVASQQGGDAAAVVFDGWQAARARGRDVLLVDTAGRLHTKAHLMDELAKIRRVLSRQDPAAPHDAWLVVDGSHGSNAIEQARVFHQVFPLTGLVVTKLDGTSRGGAIVGIYRELHLPIHFVGLGEQPEDLQPYAAAAYARSVFGLDERS